MLYSLLIQRGCQRAVDAIVEPGEEAESPDKDDVSVIKSAVEPGRRSSTRRKLNMVDDEATVEQEGIEVVAFVRRGTKNRNIKRSAATKKCVSISDQDVKKRHQGLSRKPTRQKRKQQKDEIAAIELGDEDEILVIDSDIPQKRHKSGKVEGRKMKQFLLDTEDVSLPKVKPTRSSRIVCDTVERKSVEEEAGTTDGHLIPSPVSNPNVPRREEKSTKLQTEKPFHDICRWLTRSLSHPLSKETSHAIVRPALQEAVDFIKENVKSTIEQSFNNSIIVFGAPGSGKTMTVSRVCSQVDAEWNTVPGDPKVGIVRLSGMAFSDEKSAFKEIARQICITLNLEYLKNASFGENIKFLLSILKAMADANKAALFILEDFDLFAQAQKQTFLYCLLDSLQKSNAKAIVVGTTCRHDCLDLLEKRVRSRFSHRTVTLIPPTNAVDEDNGALKTLMSMLTLPAEVYPDAESARDHNKKVQTAFDEKEVVDVVSRLVESSNSLHVLSDIARKCLLSCSKQGYFSSRHLQNAIASHMLRHTRGFEVNISNLCPLDLVVLAAAHKVRKQREDSILNFEMIHHEFRSYVATGSHVDNYSKVAAMKSFEHLISQGILRYTRRASGPLCRRDRNFAQVSLQITRQELLQGFDGHPYADIRLRDWCQKDGGPSTTALQTFA